MSDPSSIVSLRDYIDRRFEAIEKAMAKTEHSQQVAIDRANEVLGVRLQAVNEFRASLEDQTRNYVTRSEFDGCRVSTDVKIEALQKQQAMIFGALLALQALLQFFG